MLDAVLNVFAVMEPALAHPFREAGNRLLVAMLVIKHEKARHLRPLDQHMPLDPRSDRPRIP